jgi:hypothetical protein
VAARVFALAVVALWFATPTVGDAQTASVPVSRSTVQAGETLTLTFRVTASAPAELYAGILLPDLDGVVLLTDADPPRSSSTTPTTSWRPGMRTGADSPESR